MDNVLGLGAALAVREAGAAQASSLCEAEAGEAEFIRDIADVGVNALELSVPGAVATAVRLATCNGADAGV